MAQASQPSATLVSFFISQVSPFLATVLSNDQFAAFSSPRHVAPLLQESFTVVDNLQFLGSKLLKSAASSFAYSSFPTADTEKLTAVVANLVSGESLGPFITKIKAEKESMFHVLLGYCCRVLGVDVTANAVLGEYFDAALEITKNALDIPQIICSLRPGTHLQGLTRDQRIDLVRQELRSRFVYVSEPQLVQGGSGDGDVVDGDEGSSSAFSPAASSVLLPDRQQDGTDDNAPHRFPVKAGKDLELQCYRVSVSRGTQEEQSVHFYSESEAREYVLVVARQYIKNLKDSRKFGGAGTGNADDDADDGEEPARNAPPKLTLDDVDPAQAQSFGLFIMHTCKRILRFESPYDDTLETMGRLSQCIEAGGWIPITDVQTLLLEHLAVTCSNIEQPSIDFICRMLEEHDGLQRFDIGLCTLPSSPFYGVRCARALYAHHGAVACATVPLYRSILDAFERPSVCPPTGWMLADSKQIKNYKTRGFRLFDNNLLLTIVSQEAITSTFVPYLERGTRDVQETPFLQRCMLDEKVRAPMFFVEVYLGAAFHDSHMTVKQHPDRGDTPGHFIVMPTGHRYRKKTKGGEQKFFPLRFLSGRTLELKHSSPLAREAVDTAPQSSDNQHRGSIQIVAGTVSLPPDPIVQFDEAELEELLRLGGGTAAEPISTDAASTLDEAPPPEIVRLDDGPLRERVEAFHRDENIVMMELEVPRCTRTGGTLFERSKSVSDLKTWITTLGLEYRELPRKAGCDVFLLRKHQAFPEYVLDEIIAELSLENLGRKELLRQAITRECINSTENYERLEFIGDAVLDLVVALDAAIVYGGCMLPEDYDRIQSLPSSLAAAAGSAGSLTAPVICSRGASRSVVQVAVDVCRNEILCELLPSTLRIHMEKLYGNDVPLKVKADMFEAIVGAVYDSELGLDTVRRVISDLYHQSLHDAMKRKDSNPEALWKFRLAMQLCPYINNDALVFVSTIQPLRCTVIMVGKNQELLATDGDGATAENGIFGAGKKRSTAAGPVRKYATANSHLASTGFPRIQDKDYATHFTTGTVYSYRRLGEHDLPVMHNRMLHLFNEGSVGFVNETLGEVTKLTFDIDGVNMKSYGLIHILKEWIRTTWGRTNSSPCALILNCSGRSVVSKKQKYSCHVHIPDRVLSIHELARHTSSFRKFIVDYFARKVRENCLGTGSIVTGKVLVASCTASAASPHRTATTIIGRIVLDLQLMQKRFVSVMEHEANVEWSSASIDAYGYRSLPEGWTSPARKAALLLSFLGLRDILVAMSVSKTFYRAGTLLLAEDVDNTDQWIRRYLLPLQQASPLAAADEKSPKVSTKVSLVGSQNLSLRNAQIVHCLNPDFSWSGRYTLCECAHSGFSYVRTSQDVESFVDEHGAGKAKRFFELLQPFLDKSLFDAQFWEKTVDHGLVESKKLRLYLNDKFDTVYGQEFRPLLFDSVVDPHAEDSTTCDPSLSSSLRGADAAVGHSSDEHTTGVMHVNHRALLEAATLRSPNAWNAYGAANELWEPSMFADLPCVDSESVLDMEVDLEASAGDLQWSTASSFLPVNAATTVSRNGHLLPPFNAIRQTPVGLVVCNDWQLWSAGVFSITEVREDNWGQGGGGSGGGSSKIQRHGALFPASWAYCDKTRTAMFQVLGESLLFVASVDLTAALSDYGAKGMMMLSRILTPHVGVDAQWRAPSHQLRSCLELWEEGGRGGMGGSGQSTAQQQQQPRGSGQGSYSAKPETVVVNGVTLKSVSTAPPPVAPAVSRSAVALSVQPPQVVTKVSAHTNFEEGAAYFRMKFDRIDFQMMGDMQGRSEMLDGSAVYQPLDALGSSGPLLTDLAVASAIRRWTKSWQGLVGGRGALVATSRPALGSWFMNVASDAFAPYLSVQVLDYIKPSKKATAELRNALASTEPPFSTIIYAEKSIETSKFYWLLERLQPHGTCWFVFSQAYEDARKLRGASCFNS
jgi:dsRNA-specific ribonuclease